jgi:DNA-binding MarR family transcriptional regulator
LLKRKEAQDSHLIKNKEDLKQLTELLKEQHDDLRIRNSFDLLRVSGLMDRFLDIGYRKTRLKRIQILILSIMVANGGVMTPTELKTKVFRSDNAISKTLDNLDKLGLTRSSGTKADRRLRKVTLTEKGMKTIKMILPVRADLFIKATSSLTKEESEALESILQKIMDHLLEITGKREQTKKEKFFF